MPRVEDPMIQKPHPARATHIPISLPPTLPSHLITILSTPCTDTSPTAPPSAPGIVPCPKHTAGRDVAYLMALCADPLDQHHAIALARSRCDPRLRPCARGSPARLHGGRRTPQRGRQDRGLDVPEPRARARQDFLYHWAPHL